MKDLTEKAMRVTLSISVWTARKYDKKVSKEVADNHNTVMAVGRYNKRLLPIDAASYKAVLSAATEARNTHYENTVPWDDTGWRLLPAANFFKYSGLMRERRAAFEKAVEEFLQDYPRLHENAKAILKNGLYNPADFPTARQLEQKFAMRIEREPISDANDFRVSLTDDSSIDEIREEITSNAERRLAEAMRDPWNRLFESVSHIVERLSDPEKIFRNSLVENLSNLCDLLPALNLIGDPRLDELVKEVKYRLISDPQTLRENPGIRAQVAAEADKIQRRMAGYMGVAAPSEVMDRLTARPPAA